MRGAERASSSSVFKLLRSYLHTSPRRRLIQPEPKSDKERAKLGLPLREPWFEVKPFDEKKKNFVLRLKEILQAQPQQKIEIASLGQLRQELDVVRQGKQRKIATYVRRFPSAFSLRSFYTPNNKKKTWCSFSANAVNLLVEEDLLFQACEALHVQKLRKLLMISMKNRVPFSSVNQVRESLGLPFDFEESLVNKHADVFLLKERKGCLYLELKDWDDTLAISALEKHAQEGYPSKTSKKSKKQKRERLVVEGDGNEQEALCGTEHEQSFLSEEEDVESILQDEEEEEEHLNLSEDGEGYAHEEEEYEEEEVSSKREGEAREEEASHDQSSLSKEEVNATVVREAQEEEASHGQTSLSRKEAILTNECKEEKTNSVHAPESKGYQQCSLAVHGGCELGTLKVPGGFQENISSTSDHQDDEVIATTKSTHTVDQCLSASVVEKHQQDAGFVHGVTQNGTEVDVSSGAGNVHHSKSNGEKQCESVEGMHQNSARLPFPWKNKRGKQPNSQRAVEIAAFQFAPYISPYRNSRELELPLKSLAMEKFVVAVLHEFLSLTLEKRATLQQLELFQRPYRLPGNLLDFLLKYDGIFYVVRGKTKSHVFLKEAYKESILLEKDPLVLWQERFVELALTTQKPEKSKPSNGSLPQKAMPE